MQYRGFTDARQKIADDDEIFTIKSFSQIAVYQQAATREKSQNMLSWVLKRIQYPIPSILDNDTVNIGFDKVGPLLNVPNIVIDMTELAESSSTTKVIPLHEVS